MTRALDDKGNAVKRAWKVGETKCRVDEFGECNWRHCEEDDTGCCALRLLPRTDES